MSNINLVSFLDGSQRTIIAELVEDGAVELTVKNPVVVNIVPQTTPEMVVDKITGQPTPTGREIPNGQMALQLLPVYFREFQGEKKNPAIFTYKQAVITRVNFDGGFDFRLYGQYEHIFNPPTAPIVAPTTPAASAAAVPVLKLFSEGPK